MFDSEYFRLFVQSCTTFFHSIIKILEFINFKLFQLSSNLFFDGLRSFRKETFRASQSFHLECFQIWSNFNRFKIKKKLVAVNSSLQSRYKKKKRLESPEVVQQLTYNDESFHRAKNCCHNLKGKFATIEIEFFFVVFLASKSEIYYTLRGNFQDPIFFSLIKSVKRTRWMKIAS